MKRTALGDFANPRAGGVIAAGVKAGDGICDVAVSDGLAEVMLLSGSSRAIRFAESEVPVVGRTAQGVKGKSIKGGDQVVGMVLIRRDANILAVTEEAQGKRIPVGEFPLQKRGGMGTLVTSGGGRVVAALEVLESDEVMLISAGGKVNRVAADLVPVQGRRTQGRKILKLPAGDRIVEVTRTQGDGGEPAEAPLSGTPQLDLLGE
jgi:DNA gyrase subunit A